MDTDAVNTLSVVTKCVIAGKLETIFQNQLKDCLLESGGTPAIFVGEKNLLSLATYVQCTDAILYGMPFILEVDGVNYLYIRYFFTFYCRFLLVTS